MSHGNQSISANSLPDTLSNHTGKPYNYIT